jgi:hypothetical protein
MVCFDRDIAGALGLHNASVVQYIRPEIIGGLLGATVVAVFAHTFSIASLPAGNAAFGPAAVVVCLVVYIVIGMTMREARS